MTVSDDFDCFCFVLFFFVFYSILFFSWHLYHFQIGKPKKKIISLNKRTKKMICLLVVVVVVVVKNEIEMKK